MLKILPESEIALKILESENQLAYLAGGCVRDLIMGKAPHDWDITTSAEPETIKNIFESSGYKTIPTGIAHGTVTVLINGEPIEITTFRSESAYSDHRHPDKVEFVKTPEADVMRRDFTMNGLHYNPKTGVLDFVGGIKDIKAKIIRTIGNPDARFSEDALRIMRAMRFSSCLGFEIEEKTSDSMLKNRKLLDEISPERKRDELNKLIVGENVQAVLCKYQKIIETIIPETKDMVGFDQNNPHHCYDVWTHTIVSVAQSPAQLVLRLTMLLHDIGKPLSHTLDSSGVSHFYTHPEKSAKMAEQILTYLRYPTDIKEQILTLIKFHDFRFSAEPKPVKKLLSKIGEENFRLLLKVKRADIAAQSSYYKAEKLELLDDSEKILEQVLYENQCFSLKKLDINGKDLIRLGIPQGKEIGRILDTLLSMVINEEIPNEKKLLEEAAKNI